MIQIPRSEGVSNSSMDVRSANIADPRASGVDMANAQLASQVAQISNDVANRLRQSELADKTAKMQEKFLLGLRETEENARVNHEGTANGHIEYEKAVNSYIKSFDSDISREPGYLRKDLSTAMAPLRTKGKLNALDGQIKMRRNYAGSEIERIGQRLSSTAREIQLAPNEAMSLHQSNIEAVRSFESVLSPEEVRVASTAVTKSFLAAYFSGKEGLEEKRNILLSSKFDNIDPSKLSPANRYLRDQIMQFPDIVDGLIRNTETAITLKHETQRKSNELYLENITQDLVNNPLAQTPERLQDYRLGINRIRAQFAERPFDANAIKTLEAIETAFVGITTAEEMQKVAWSAAGTATPEYIATQLKNTSVALEKKGLTELNKFLNELAKSRPEQAELLKEMYFDYRLSKPATASKIEQELAATVAKVDELKTKNPGKYVLENGSSHPTYGVSFANNLRAVQSGDMTKLSGLIKDMDAMSTQIVGMPTGLTSEVADIIGGVVTNTVETNDFQAAHSMLATVNSEVSADAVGRGKVQAIAQAWYKVGQKHEKLAGLAVAAYYPEHFQAGLTHSVLNSKRLKEEYGRLGEKVPLPEDILTKFMKHDDFIHLNRVLSSFGGAENAIVSGIKDIAMNMYRQKVVSGEIPVKIGVDSSAIDDIVKQLDMSRYLQTYASDRGDRVFLSGTDLSREDFNRFTRADRKDRLALLEHYDIQPIAADKVFREGMSNAEIFDKVYVGLFPGGDRIGFESDRDDPTKMVVVFNPNNILEKAYARNSKNEVVRIPLSAIRKNTFVNAEGKEFNIDTSSELGRVIQKVSDFMDGNTVDLLTPSR
jgi:hypothetical protein